jgi:hemerythrin-like domain-containing protein
MRTHHHTTICHEKGNFYKLCSCPLAKPMTSQNDIFTVGATHMAHIHNAILRGYNSIYLQAPHVSDADKPVFIGYALTWYRFVKSHHDSEELELFPAVEDVLGRNDIWAESHREHRTYDSGGSQRIGA